MDTIRSSAADTDWFVKDRFGMFIHWGLYSLAARCEWFQNYEKIDAEGYHKYFEHFNPDLYDPQLWADAAAKAGMKYFAVTTKHHEGFCLWDSAYTDFKVTNTPYRRDVMQPMIKAFRDKGMRLGLYHSLIDWHHEDFIIDDLHPLRDHQDRNKLNEGRDQKRYIKFLHSQIEELLTQFGQVDMLWLDFSYPAGWHNKGSEWVGKGRNEWDSENLYKLVRKLQPRIIINDRLDLKDCWDIKTPEQFQPRKWVTVNGQKVVWEACQTFSGAWGYHRDQHEWKSVEMLLQMLIDTVSKGGNFMLNVGPTGRGEFDERTLSRLEGIGKWMRYNSRSIYNCTQAPAEFIEPKDCRLTYNPEKNVIYIHLFSWPFQQLHLYGFKNKIKYAQLLSDASEVKILNELPEWQTRHEGIESELVSLELPIIKPNQEVPVIEVFLKNE